ncbi:autotransporter [Pseudomonas sp. 2(2015)]|nr:autotransporter [Pseudomonas sp. 2(2015)]
MRVPLFLTLGVLPWMTFALDAEAEDRVVVDGDVFGDIVQTPQADTLTMSGGTVQSLDQGDGRDLLIMTGGHIVGTFANGNSVALRGGRIGRIELQPGNGDVALTSGSIDGDLITGDGHDFLVFRGTVLGGNLITGKGIDLISFEGGEIHGNVSTGPENDHFNWKGGQLYGSVDMGDTTDQVLMVNLRAEQLFVPFNGGAARDELHFQNSFPTNGALYTNWESISLGFVSHYTLNDTLVLGDGGGPIDVATGTGDLFIGRESTLFSSTGVIRPFAAGLNARLGNTGLVDLRNSGDGQGRLTVIGNYFGNEGRLAVNTVLGTDDSPSDRLVISQGAISGDTALLVTNLHGPGGLTRQDGILVVEAANGATSTDTAFTQTQRLSAGAFDYRLFKGGITPGSENNWYLSSALVAPADGRPPPLAAPAPGLAELPRAIPGQVIPLYRSQASLYAAAPRAAALIGQFNLGTFHQRQGDQRLLSEQGALAASWAQAHGYSFHQSWSGSVSPSLDGNLYGYKAGQDLFASPSAADYRQHIGVYVGHSRLNGDVKGYAQGFADRPVGDLRLDGDSAGVYWTLIGPQHGYLDMVVQYTDLDGRARSEDGEKIDLDGHAWGSSLEVGRPFALSNQWSLEPQAQVLVQKVSLDKVQDGVSTVSFDTRTEVSSRLGLRLEGNLRAGTTPLQAYLQTNIWHADGGHDSLVFAGVDQVRTDYRSTSLEVGTGLVAQLHKQFSVHLGIDYASNLDSRQQERVGANLGIRISY